ncbi:MAG: FG-GAP-like repeat-containing protein, partial [Planctomycetota bacterium]|nr:FG-GAP-like repeat-containing protein [Planctomycetota bacterium]
MSPSATSLKVVVSAIALILGCESIIAQQPAEAGGWYGKIQQDSSHRIDMPSATLAGGNDVFIASDINNDGSSDYIAAGVYVNPVSGVTWARVYAYSGYTGEILYVWENSSFNFGDKLRVAVAGDIDSDGYPEIIVGAPKASANGKQNCGAVALVSGRNGKTLKLWLGKSSGSFFGSSVAGVDDVDRNGFKDVAIGAPGTWYNGPNTGAAYVFSGSYYGDPNIGQPLYAFYGAHSDSGFGTSVAAADDINRDGFPDIAVSAPGFDSIRGHNYPGTVDVFSGQDSSVLAHYQGRRRAHHFGFSIAGVGDIDRDGYPDIAVGVPAFKSDSAPSKGGVIVFSGLNSSVIRKYESYEYNDAFGYSVVGVGDTNGDFWPDIFIGAPSAENGRGSATLFSGHNDAILFRTLGDDTTSRLGASLGSAGSLNRYGFVDLMALSSSVQLGSMISRYAFTEGLSLPTGDTISSSNPSRVRLSINMPREMAGQVYQVLVTTAGTSLWKTAQGIQMPLAASSVLMRSKSNSLPWFFNNELGYLSYYGNADATIDFPTGFLNSVVGSSI